MKKLKFSFAVIFLVLTIFTFLFPKTVLGINSVSEGWKVLKNSTKLINVWGTGRTVVNNASKDIFVPTKIQTEWTSFITYPPASTTVPPLPTCTVCQYLGESACENYATTMSCSTTGCSGNNYYYVSGTGSPTGTNYTYYRSYNNVTVYCNGGGVCNNYTCNSYGDSLIASCGTCKYAVNDASGCANYNTSTACSSTSCSSNNYYWNDGTNIYLRSYSDATVYCNGSGSCSNYSCSSYSDNFVTSCSGCYVPSGSACAYRPTSYVCSSTSCSGSNYYYISGTASPTGTNYTYYRAYNNVNVYCNGAGSCNTYTCNSYGDSLIGTCGTCKYASGDSNGCTNYNTSTACSSTSCSGSNYYWISGQTIYLRSYSDATIYCNGSGSCNNYSCSAYSDSVVATCNSCQYPSGSSCVNYGATESCGPTDYAAYWKFDEGSGSSVADSSGGGRTGTFSGGASWTASGKLGSALVFDGSTNGVTASAPFTQNTDWTLAAWVKSSMGGSGAGGVIQMGGPTCSGYTITYNGGVFYPLYSCIAWNTSFAYGNDGTWQHLVVTRTGGVTKSYLNGTQITTDYSTPAAMGASNVTIGSAEGAYRFRGTIDDVKIYSRALSGAEITSLATNTCGKSCGTTSCASNNNYWNDGTNIYLRSYSDATTFCSAGACSSYTCNAYSDSFITSCSGCKYPSGSGCANRASSYGCSTANCSGSNGYWNDGTNIYYRTYNNVTIYCDGSGNCNQYSCNSYSDSFVTSCSGCQYPSGSGCANYNSSTACSSTGCSGNNSYWNDGTNVYYRTYNNVTVYCNGSGTCNNYTCNSYYDTLITTCTGCQQPNGGSGCQNKASGSSCGGSNVCDASGNCNNPNCPAVGGVVTWDGTYCRHKFTTSGSFSPTSNITTSYLVVAGGGGGGMDMGGGGGGGGVLYSTGVGLTPQAYTVTVGAGGAGGPAGCSSGQSCDHMFNLGASNGSDSSFNGSTAIGGGKGGSSYYDYTPGAAGGNGGSGGGASGYSNGGYKSGGAGTAGQGNNGGQGGPQYYSGGGGGAGGAGTNSTSQPHGGVGVENSILGTSYYWGGGGGGASYSLGTGGNGGNGGGGGGAVGTTYGGAGLNAGANGGGGCNNCQANAVGGNGGANTGGGGGGGSHYNRTNNGGNGGSGIVVIKYEPVTGCNPGSACGSISCASNNGYWNNGTDIYYRTYNDATMYCNSSRVCDQYSCTSYSDAYVTSCSGCSYPSGSGCAYYGGGTQCSTQSCAGSNSYTYTYPGEGTNIYYRSYSDVPKYCDGSGNCNQYSCGSYTDSYVTYCNACQYATGSSCGNHASGTACNGGTCDGSGRCVYSGCTASGGTSNYAYGRCVHTFTSSGTFVPPADMSLRLLLVGGGGGGGRNPSGDNRGGGGGGAGGVLYFSSYNVGGGGNFSVTVGGGGAGGNVGGSGASSAFAGSGSAYGGGGGGQGEGGSGNGGSGGSGGGCGDQSGASYGGSGSSGQGNKGGDCPGSGGNGAEGGGGGGAGGAGGVRPGGYNNAGGGVGVINAVTGGDVMYATGGAAGCYFCGDNGYNGAANTGNGGSGARTGSAGNGGSGVVILSYAPIAGCTPGNACGTTVCSGTNYYWNNGTSIYYRSYSDVTTYCSSSRVCDQFTCNVYSDSLIATCGTCTYPSGSSCVNSSSGTACTGGTCNGSGTCVASSGGSPKTYRVPLTQATCSSNWVYWSACGGTSGWGDYNSYGDEVRTAYVRCSFTDTIPAGSTISNINVHPHSIGYYGGGGTADWYLNTMRYIDNDYQLNVAGCYNTDNVPTVDIPNPNDYAIGGTNTLYVYKETGSWYILEGQNAYFDVTVTYAAPVTCPTGYAFVPGNATYGTNSGSYSKGGFCVAKYEMKVDANLDGIGDNAATYACKHTSWEAWAHAYGGCQVDMVNRKIVSTPQGSVLSNISEEDSETKCAALGAGYHLITNNEWMTIARDIERVGSNWTGGSVGSGSLYVGNCDSSPGTSIDAGDGSDPYYRTGNAGDGQRRTFNLSNGQVVWDMSGNGTEWISYDFTGTGMPDAVYDGGGAVSGTVTVDYGPGGGTGMYLNAASLGNTTFTANDLFLSNTGYNSNQGVGRAYILSNSGDGGYKHLFRGGHAVSGAAAAGILTLSHAATGYYNSQALAFRCVYMP